MLKLWLVAKQGYLKRVQNRSFLIGTLIIPVLLGAGIGITIFVIDRDKNTNPVGYVDYSQVLSPGIPSDPEEKTIEFIPFENAESARDALFLEEIQAYYIVPEDYLKSHQVELYYLDETPDESTQQAFDNYIRGNLLPDGPNLLQNRIIEGVSLSILSSDGKRSFDQEMGFIAILFPMAVALFFFFAYGVTFRRNEWSKLV